MAEQKELAFQSERVPDLLLRVLQDVGQVEEGDVALQSVRKPEVSSGQSRLDFGQNKVAQHRDPVLVRRRLREKVGQIGGDLEKEKVLKT